MMNLKEYITKIKNITDESPDERVYQTKVIQPLLEEIYEKYQVIDVSWTKRTTMHTKRYYTFPADENEGLEGTSPDIIVTTDYRHNNRNNNPPNIKIDVEVKCPYPQNSELRDIDIVKCTMHPIDEVARYLQVVDKVILTDCSRWLFFDRRRSKKKITNDCIKDYLRKITTLSWYKLLSDKNKRLFEKDEQILIEYVNNYYPDLKRKVNNSTMENEYNRIEWYHDTLEAISGKIKNIVKECQVKSIELLDKKTHDYYLPDLEVKESDEAWLKSMQDLLDKINIPIDKWDELIDYLKSFPDTLYV